MNYIVSSGIARLNSIRRLSSCGMLGDTLTVNSQLCGSRVVLPMSKRQFSQSHLNLNLLMRSGRRLPEAKASSTYLARLTADKQLALRARVREKVLGVDADRSFRLRAKARAVRGVR